MAQRKQPPGEVLTFMRSLWAMDHSLRSTSKRMRSSLGVTGPQRLVIRMIGQHPDIDAGHLAELLHLHPSTLTGVIARLESKSYIRRTLDPSDGRRHLFRLSQRGERINRMHAGTVESKLRIALSELKRHEIEIARKVLDRLAEALREDE